MVFPFPVYSGPQHGCGEAKKEGVTDKKEDLVRRTPEEEELVIGAEINEHVRVCRFLQGELWRMGIWRTRNPEGERLL